MEEDLLIMIGGLYKPKVVLQCGNKSKQPLGVGWAVDDLDGYSALQAGPFHLTNTKLHLQEIQPDTVSTRQAEQQCHLCSFRNEEMN